MSLSRHTRSPHRGDVDGVRGSVLLVQVLVDPENGWAAADKHTAGLTNEPDSRGRRRVAAGPLLQAAERHGGQGHKRLAAQPKTRMFN